MLSQVVPRLELSESYMISLWLQVDALIFFYNKSTLSIQST